MPKRKFVIAVGMTKLDKRGTEDGECRDWARDAGAAVVPVYMQAD